MTFEAERQLCAGWRTAATTAPLRHDVASCRCWCCAMCRGLEALILEVDRLTGPDGIGSGGVPGGV